MNLFHGYSFSFHLAGHYMYVEMSSPAQTGQIAIMSSKSFPPTSNRTITFKYTMKGAKVTYLEVNKVDDGSGTKTQLFRQDGHQANAWLPYTYKGISIKFASAVNYTVSCLHQPFSLSRGNFRLVGDRFSISWHKEQFQCS